jgi:regulator of nucleoside diphosphate kinase
VWDGFEVYFFLPQGLSLWRVRDLVFKSAKKLKINKGVRMEQLPSLVISQEDYQKISVLLSVAKVDIADQLAEELGRAELVPYQELPFDIVSMNSRVTFIDLDTDKEQSVTLTYPNEANIELGKISILAPVGAALIGLRIGQTIDWPVADGKVRRMKVISVTRDE